MYTIIIADDEEELRKALIRRVNWEEIGFTVIGEAENGMEALELVEKLEPDLLLTDIRMPYLSGIELARQIREVRPSTNIAFLSGFDDFKYAQQAIQYNILSYMLKPISAATLTQEMLQIKQKIDERFQEFARVQDKPMLHPFLVPLTLDAYQDKKSEEELVNEAIACGLISNNRHDFRYVVMTTAIYDEAGNNITREAYVHSLDMILQKYVKHGSFFAGNKIISLLIATPADMDKYLHILTAEIVQSVERILNCSAIIGVSRLNTKIGETHEGYVQAVKAMNYEEGRGVSGVHFISDAEKEDNISVEDIDEVILNVENKIRGGSEEELENYIREIFQKIHRTQISVAKANFLLIRLLSSVYRIVSAVGDEETLRELEQYSLMKGLSFYDSGIQEIEDRMLDICKMAKKLIIQQKQKSGDLLCQRTLKIIEEQYSDSELSLVSVSSEIGVSPNYLSMLIKREMGKTFVEILTEKRIDVARDLLMYSSMKIREISEKCGYNDQHYFSYCFKKNAGISPNALRVQNEQPDK